MIGELYEMKLGSQYYICTLFSPTPHGWYQWREDGAGVGKKWERELNYSYMNLVYLVV